MSLLHHDRPVTKLVFTCMVLALALLGLQTAANAAESAAAQSSSLHSNADFNYENAMISEDVTWNGTVLVKGWVIVAPQATVRIDPGTVVRFTGTTSDGAKPRLVVKGRLQSGGTPEKPVLFAPNTSGHGKAGWGGILFIATEKRNQLDNMSIEGAETAIEGHFSTLSGRGVTIVASQRGMSFRDSTVTMSNVTVNGCDTGLEINDTELDIRGGSIAGNRIGITAHRTSLVLSSLLVKGNERHGIEAEECRLKINNCEFVGNSVGALFRGGEGQLAMNRFTGNREAGLRLSSARVRFNRNIVADNVKDGMQVEGNHSVIWDNVFSGNGGYNLANAGRDEVTAVLNWWGVTDDRSIRAKLLDMGRDSRLGHVTIAPWLTEKPSLLPERL